MNVRLYVCMHSLATLIGTPPVQSNANQYSRSAMNSTPSCKQGRGGEGGHFRNTSLCNTLQDLNITITWETDEFYNS